MKLNKIGNIWNNEPRSRNQCCRGKTMNIILAECVCLALARMGERSGVYTVFVGKSEGKRSLGRPKRSRLEDNIKTDIQEVGWGGP